MKKFRKLDYFDGANHASHAIGKDLCLIDANSYWQDSDEAFVADATVAVFVIRGSVDVQVNMVDYHVESASMFITMEGMLVRHRFRTPDTKLDVIVLSKKLTDSILTEANVTLQLKKILYESPIFPITATGSNVILRSFHFLLRVLVRDSNNSYRLDAVRHMTLTLFYGFALNRSPSVQTKSLSRKDELTKQYLDLLRTNFRKERSVAWYADKLFVTPKYLSQVVKDSTGRPALEWIDEFIIVESKALLRTTDLTIDQISVKLNFMSSSLFSKYFKRVTGISPREYRIS